MRLERLEAVTDAALGYLALETSSSPSSLLGRVSCSRRTPPHVLLLDETGNELVARAAVGLEEEVEQAIRIPSGQGSPAASPPSAARSSWTTSDRADVLNPILREKGVKACSGRR